MSEYNRHKWAMEWMHGGGRDPNGRGLDDEIRIGKEDWMERQRVAQGGRIGLQSGQLVQPGPGRQGYQGNQYIMKPNPYAKNKDFIKFAKDNRHLSRQDLMDKFGRIFSKKNKIVGMKGLVEALGGDNPYTLSTLQNAYPAADTKITKNMSNLEKNIIKQNQRIKKIIVDTIGEPQTYVDIQKQYPHLKAHPSQAPSGKAKPKKIWDLNESKLKKLNKALNKNYNSVGVLPNTLENVFDLVNNEELMEALDAYKGGKINEGHPILKAILKGENTGARAHAFQILGEALRGDIELEGITKDLKRGNRIIKALHGNYRGPLGSGLLRWAKRRMAKDFDNPKNTYDSLVKSMRKALDSAGLNHLAVDEIFPARTGQLTIGKGSGAYNQIIQFIDQGINTKEKANFDAAATKRYQKIIAARKAGNWTKVNEVVKAHQTQIDTFYERNPKAKGKVKLTELQYNPKTHKFASPTKIYGKDVLPSKIQKDIDKFYRKTGLSLDVGSTMTLEKSASDVKTLTESKAWRNSIKSGKAKMLAKTLELAGIPICSSQSAKASGGRIGFAEPVCGMEFAEQNEDAFMKKAGQSEDAAKLFKSGKMGKYLRGAKSWTLANMGPAGWIGGELLIMGLGTLYETSQGKGWKEGLDTWTGLGGHFGMSEKRLKEIGKEQGWSDQQVYDAMKIGKLMELSHTGQEKEAELEGFLEQQDIGGTARYKSDPGERFIGERGYIRGKYQDPKFLRDLKEEVPEIWAEGDALYKTLMNPQTSMALHQELQDRKKYKELERKKEIWEWTKKRPFVGQQVEAPDPAELGPFERSPGHPGYTGAFINWKPDFYAEGGIASLKKK